MRPPPALQGCQTAKMTKTRAYRVCAVLWHSVLLFVATARMPLAMASPRAAPAGVAPEREDAELVDVTFVDRWRGWAVGDRGVIWHTSDGGASWRLQESAVNCRLSGVQFLNASEGWAAGGGALAPGDLSRGVLLVTRDGGRSWQQVPKLSLPAIRKLRLLDGENGWCVGEPSALFPAGAATTRDGGRTWEPVAGDGSRGWLTGDFVDLNDGALASSAGALVTVRRRGIETASNPRLGLRAIHALRLGSDGAGWLVGDAGLVLTTTGKTINWQVPGGEPPDITNQFDWQGVATVGDHVWIAGSPGSRILHSTDGGKSWSLQPTGQCLPLYGLAFADSKHGWAVGALGTILATSDGGESWQKQRAGGARAAWLAVYSEPRELPLELWGRLSAADGYLGAVDFVARRDAASDASDELTLADRAREALTTLGASNVETMWRFPLPARGIRLSAKQILESWNRASDGRAIERLQEHLTCVLRTWRPEVVVTHAAFPRGDRPLEHLINQLVLHAVEAAADETQNPQQITEMGLGTWQVKKVFGGPTRSQHDVVKLRGADLVPQLSESLAELTRMPRMILRESGAAVADEIAFQLYYDRIPQKAGARDFFAGIALPPGSEARRRSVAADPHAAEARRQLAIRTRNLQAVVTQASRGGQDGAELVGAIEGLVRDLQGPAAGRLLYQMAEEYARGGQWALAAETMSLLAEKYPDHALAPPALAWLVRFGASSEIAWRLHAGERLRAERIESAGRDGSGVASPPEQQSDLRQPVQAAARVERADRIGIDHDRQDPAAERAIQAAKRLAELDPVRASEPAVTFPLARAYRARGLQHESDRLLLHVRQTRSHDAWWHCAVAEQWLARPEGECPKPKAACARSAARPRLDGVLDDATWKDAERIDLTSGAEDDDPCPAAALLAYDAEFLYFAASCRRAKEVDYGEDAESRPRDADLSTCDRLDLFLDLDRDASSWFRLSVDHRGWTNDACCEDVRWNPQWYVAAQTADDVWTIEVAIPLDQLTRDYPRARSVWSIGLQRVIPGTGFQSWTRPAAPAVQPEGFGYLVFE